ncbi:probable ATP-dependent RNA helicase DDX28 [Bradysia coprophila]|uniref:probable ATP-dependent RNA helicase DDX28 n=1 Tax=Bradysia coprophila TaxID=38358 RepID=UPI00187DBED1|nr:probable ATP-dependent RNA helicase DDX28 [Bradysia coprophila]
MFRNLSKVLQSSYFRTYASNPSVKQPVSPKTPLITCKVSKFNQYVESGIPKDTKFGTIPLASSGWQHYKSKGDKFTIHPIASLPHDEPADTSFADIQLDEQIVKNLKLRLDVTNPNSIQLNAFASVIRNDHTLIAAETGCGKTLAYLIPIVQKILSLKEKQTNDDMNTPTALILTPGRELASQIGIVAEKLCTNLNINVKTIIGGKTKRLMMDPEFGQVDILVGSMGAVSKLVTTGIYRMQCVRHVVVDEADTMFDDTFSDKLVHLMKRFPLHRNHIQEIDKNLIGTQLILASATMPTNTQELLQNVIDTTTINEVVSPSLHRLLPNVTQTFLRMSKMHRPIQMLAIVKEELSKKRPVIIFSNKSSSCDYVSIFLNDHDIECVNLNGDMLVQIRMGQFDKFQTGQVHVLSTTDVASRGLDTTRARHVINFDFPLHISDYIHRIGRIGRLGSHEQCEVTNFVSSHRELSVVQRIEHAARTATVLPNVNANISNIISNKLIKQMETEEKRYLKSLKE